MNASRTNCFSIELARIRISNALTSAQHCFKLRSAGSRGGLSTKIHAVTDALGNPTRFLLGQAHDLVGSDVLLTDLSAGAVIADKTLTSATASTPSPSCSAGARPS